MLPENDFEYLIIAFTLNFSLPQDRIQLLTYWSGKSLSITPVFLLFILFTFFLHFLVLVVYV